MNTLLRRVFGAAASAALLAGIVTAPPAAAADTAILSGTVTALGTGTPVAGAVVTLRDPALSAEWARVYTGADGRYQVDGMPDGVRVKIQVQAPGFVEQWSRDKPDMRNADEITMNTEQSPTDFALRAEAGSVEGVVRDQLGRGAANAQVTLKLAGGSWSAIGESELDGRYHFARIPPGVYDVTIARTDFTSRTFTDIEIRAGQTTVSDFAFTTRIADPPPTGRISGLITDGPGGPTIPGASVLLFSGPFTVMGRTTADANGFYAFEQIPYNRGVRIRAGAPGFADVWARDAPDFANARPYTLPSDTYTSGSISLRRGSGTIRGRITDPAGAGVRARVTFNRVDPSRIWRLFTRIDGTYEQPNLPPGGYRVSVAAPDLGIQWARGKEQQADADFITVTDQVTTELDEPFRPRGILEVVAVDAASGATVSTNCVSVGAAWYGKSQCTATDGVYRFSDVPPGSVSVRVRPDGSHLGTWADTAVHSAQTTRITLRLRPAGMITTTVRRAADGSIPRTCAYLVPVGLARPWPVDNGSSFTAGCNTDSQGNTVETLTIGPVATEPMQIFISGNRDKGYGAQWLGATGGTGDRRLAAVITPRQGETIAAPEIRLDPAGSISGVVRDRATGTPLVGAHVRPFGIVTGLQMECSSAPHYTACTGQDGSYRLDGLGPYSWPVEFAAAGHANQWSGGATDRFKATLVPVKPGSTTPLDASLGVEAKLTNFDRGSNPAQYWSVVAYHATTGDMVNSAGYTSPTIGGLSAGPIVLRYTPYDAPESCWYASASGTADQPRRPTVPGVVTVSTGQTIDGLRLIPGSTCLTNTTSHEPIPRRPDGTATLPGAELVPPGTAAARDFVIQDRTADPDLTADQPAPPTPRHPAPAGSTPAVPAPVTGCPMPWTRPTSLILC